MNENTEASRIITGHEPWVKLARLPDDFRFDREEGRLGVEEFSDLIRQSGLKRPIDDAPRIATMLMHANLIVTVRNKQTGQLVGVARSISDFSWYCCLSDLCVDPRLQGQGIGRALIAETKRHAGPDTTLLLLSAPAAIEFYQKIGMEILPNVFAIKRDSKSAV